MDAPGGAVRESSFSFINRCSLKDQIKEFDAPKISLSNTESVSCNLFSSRSTDNLRTSSKKVIDNNDYVVIDDDEPRMSTSVRDFNMVSAPIVAEAKAADKDSRQGNAFDETYNVKPHTSSKEDLDTGSRSPAHWKTTKTLVQDRDDDAVLLLDDSTLDQPLLNIKKDASSKLLESQSGIISGE